MVAIGTPPFNPAVIPGPILAPDGSAAAPSYAFVSQAGTGLFYTGSTIRIAFSGTVNWMIAATSILSLTGNGVIVPGPGTVGAPSFQDYNNGATGMYFPGSNAIGFSSNGTLKFTVTPTGARVVLPTSAAGLVSGDLWNNAGVVNIVT